MAKEKKGQGQGHQGQRNSGGNLLENFDAPFDRQLPYSSEAEMGVVGALLLNPAVCDDVAVILRAEDFYSRANQIIYRHLLEMNNGGSGIDLTLLAERLRSSGEMEEIGGEAYLAEVMTSVQVAAHAIHYAKIVREKAVLRDLIEASSFILGSAYEPEGSTRDLISLAEEKIFSIGDARSSGQVNKMESVITDYLSIFELGPEGAKGILTGYKKLDEMLGGLHPSELIILAARPSMGKTAFATNIAEYVAVDEKKPVLFCSLEMSRMELAGRLISSRGRIPGNHMKGRFLSSEENQRFMRVASEFSNAPFYIDDSPSRTVSEIAAVARRLKRQRIKNGDEEGGLALIVIDYLGLIAPDNPNDPRQEQVAKVARRLKGLARELEVPVLCLAQLNRMTEAGKDNRPRLSHLRESGAIEQDADVVMFVHREEYYMDKEKAEQEYKKGEAQIIVAKQRNGAVGDVDLHWIAEQTRFVDPYKAEADGFGDFNQFASAEFSGAPEAAMDDEGF